jgi:hypothetical protein
VKIAVSSVNADIVTLLRLAKLNEEMKETAGMFGVPGMLSITYKMYRLESFVTSIDFLGTYGLSSFTL